MHVISDEEIVINLASPAKEGKANKELIKRIAKCIGVATSEVIIAAGHKSREKTLLIRGATSEQVMNRLKNA